jgi:hypothetical protein
MGMRGRVRVDWMSRAEGVSRGVVSLDDKRDAVKSILGSESYKTTGREGRGLVQEREKEARLTSMLESAESRALPSGAGNFLG